MIERFLRVHLVFSGKGRRGGCEGWVWKGRRGRDVRCMRVMIYKEYKGGVSYLYRDTAETSAKVAKAWDRC